MAFIIGTLLFVIVIGLLDRALPWPRLAIVEDEQ